MEILKWVVSLWVAFFVGFGFRSYLSAKFRHYSGTMIVNKDDLSEKTVYSLVLDDYPEKLQFEKVVIFKVDKVDTSDKSSDRK